MSNEQSTIEYFEAEDPTAIRSFVDAIREVDPVVFKGYYSITYDPNENSYTLRYRDTATDSDVVFKRDCVGDWHYSLGRGVWGYHPNGLWQAVQDEADRYSDALLGV